VALTPAGVGHDDPLAPKPANLTGAPIGYAWVSTSGQILDRQIRALAEAGCIRVFADKLSGKTADLDLPGRSPRTWQLSGKQETPVTQAREQPAPRQTPP
jgi:hypothetical protein